MANIVFNTAKGRVAELHNRVDANDPATSALILVPLSTAAADATLRDQTTLAAVLAGGSVEQTTMGRKTLTDVELAAIAPDNANDRMECTLPAVTWVGATGAAVVKMLVCYDPDTTGGTDASIIPLTCFDFAVTPSGADVTMNAGPYYQAS